MPLVICLQNIPNLTEFCMRNLQDKLAGLLLEGSVKDGESLTVTASPDGLEVRQAPPEATQAEAA